MIKPQMLQQVLPNSLESEQAVIGAMLNGEELARRVVELLSPDDFYYQANKVIYNEILAMLADKVPMDALLLVQRLRDGHQLNDVGGSGTITDCLSQCPSGEVLEHCARIVASKALQRRIIEHAHNLTLKAFAAEDASQIVPDAIADLSKINDATAYALGREQKSGFKSMEEMEQDFTAFTLSLIHI